MKSRREGRNEREREWRNTCTSKGEKEGLKEGGGGTCIMDGGMERDSKWGKEGENEGRIERGREEMIEGWKGQGWKRWSE